MRVAPRIEIGKFRKVAERVLEDLEDFVRKGLDLHFFLLREPSRGVQDFVQRLFLTLAKREGGEFFGVRENLEHFFGARREQIVGDAGFEEGSLEKMRFPKKNDMQGKRDSSVSNKSYQASKATRSTSATTQVS